MVQEGSGVLRAAGLEAAEHDARVLLAETAGVDLHDLDKGLLLGWDLDQLTVPARNAAQALGDYRDWLQRRSEREPLQYILGHTAFRMLDLAVGPGVFIPRPETETVVQAGLDWIAAQGLSEPVVVDLCAGSGAVGLSVATEVGGARVWAVEASDEAAVWTRRNADAQSQALARSGSSYHLVFGDATSGTVLAELDGRVDLVISNPPYIPMDRVPTQPEVRDWDPALALYGGSPDGCLIPEGIIKRAADLLRPGGLLVMEHDCSQGRALRSMARRSGYVNVSTGQDLAGLDRYLLAQVI
nr:peptide chain release factor N(5)-glutamine methyltransferase [Bifidobacterium indicum]